MGFLQKVIKPFKKIASFAGKVVKGAQSGGLIGAGAAFVKNLGGSSKKKKKPAAKEVYKNGVPSGAASGSGVRFQTDRFQMV